MPFSKLTNELHNTIMDDIIDCYKAKFGESWTSSLTKNLRPSPIKHLAMKYNVSENAVKNIKHEVWIIGCAIACTNTIQ
jgi:hypothetical protein